MIMLSTRNDVIISVVNEKYRNGLWLTHVVFLIRSSAGGKKYVTRLKSLFYYCR